MLEKRTKIFILIFLLFVLLATFMLNTSERVRVNPSKTPNGKAPIRKMDVTLAQYQHDQLFEQLRKFADAHTFKILISQTDPSGENFIVEMWREDIEIIGIDSGDPGLFRIGFYNKDEERPVPLLVIHELTLDLRELIGEIPNTTFSIVE